MAVANATSDHFRFLMTQVAVGWSTNDTERALSAFDENAVYMEPPDLQLYRGHKELRWFFNQVQPNSSMTWHSLWFDEESGIGAGEYTFHNGGRETAAHGVAVVEIRNSRIAVFREYQRRGAIDYSQFLEIDGKHWQSTSDG